MGWYLPSTTPSSLPMNMLTNTAGARTAREMMAVRRKASTALFLFRCQAETASMTMAPVTREARTRGGRPTGTPGW